MYAQKVQTSYMISVYDIKSFQKTVDKTIVIARELHQKYKFDTIAFSGMSGAAMSYILSFHLGVELLCVRKKGDQSHFHTDHFSIRKDSVLEGNMEAKRYMIVDDFISGGTTVSYIISSIKKDVPNAICTNMLMYAAYRDSNYNPYLEDTKSYGDPIAVFTSRVDENDFKSKQQYLSGFDWK